MLQLIGLVIIKHGSFSSHQKGNAMI